MSPKFWTHWADATAALAAPDISAKRTVIAKASDCFNRMGDNIESTPCVRGFAARVSPCGSFDKRPGMIGPLIQNLDALRVLSEVDGGVAAAVQGVRVLPVAR